MGFAKRVTGLFRKPAILQGSTVVLDQGILSIATFLAGVLVARSNTKEEYGIYVLGWSLIMIFQSLHRGLVMLPFTVYVSRLSIEEQKYYKGSALVHTLAIGTIVVCGLLGYNQFTSGYKGTDSASIQSLFIILSIALFPFLLRELFRGALLAQLRVFESLIPNVIATVIFIGLVTIYFVKDKLAYPEPFKLLAITSTIAVAALIWTDRHRIVFPSRKRVWDDFLRNWKIGKWILANLIAFIAASQSYLWLLLALVSSESVAVFGACSAVAGLLAPFLRGASSYILPRMSHSFDGSDTDGLMRILRVSTLVLAIPYIVWLLIGSAMGDRLITLIYSDEYRGYGLLFILLLIRTTIEGVSTPLTSALQALERPQITTKSLVLGASVALAAGSILISTYGLTGAGVAALMSSSVTAAYKWWAIRNLVSSEKTRLRDNTSSNA